MKPASMGSAAAAAGAAWREKDPEYPLQGDTLVKRSES